MAIHDRLSSPNLPPSASDQKSGLKWSGQFQLVDSSWSPASVSTSSEPKSRHYAKALPPGDKILLPQSALEQILSAAASSASSTHSSSWSTSAQPPAYEDDPRAAYLNGSLSNLYHNPNAIIYGQTSSVNYGLQRQRQRQDLLPHPLTFRIVNPENGRVIYAGIREFSAEEGKIELSSFLRGALGFAKQRPDKENAKNIRNEGEPAAEGADVMEVERDELSQSGGPTLTVHAVQLPKGTSVKLRPLEAGYDPEDWKALLEEHLRSNYTTLTKGEVLEVPSGRQSESFRLVIDSFKPESDGICIVDTDLEVDIEALNEEQARETVNKIAAKALAKDELNETNTSDEIGDEESNVPRRTLDLFKARTDTVSEGRYLDYQLTSWDRTRGVEIQLEMSGDNTGNEIEDELLVSPFGARQRQKPREDQFMRADFSSKWPKKIRFTTKDLDEMMSQQPVEAIWVSVRAGISDVANTEVSEEQNQRIKTPRKTTISVSVLEPEKSRTNTVLQKEEIGQPGDVQCKNCRQWVPEQRLVLHENFCLRNNIACPGCDTVFQKGSAAWERHWHCHLPHHLTPDLLTSINLSPSVRPSFHGSSRASQARHTQLFHIPTKCPACPRENPLPSLVALAHHRTTICPVKNIICQFCHLLVPQGGDPDADAPGPETIVSGLTPHEFEDGARTTDCHLCGRIVRLRDMTSHGSHHELEKKRRVAPRLCRNALCGRTIGDGERGASNSSSANNNIGLCSVCFGPLYVAAYDPDGKALMRRVERRYLSQLLTGCKHAWCVNTYCKTGRANQGPGQNKNQQESKSEHEREREKGQEQTISMKTALPMIKPFLDGLYHTSSSGSEGDKSRQTPLHFCVDEISQRRRSAAELLAVVGTEGTLSESDGGVGSGACSGLNSGSGVRVGRRKRYAMEWWVRALEVKGVDNIEGAAAWLADYAPEVEEG